MLDKTSTLRLLGLEEEYVAPESRRWLTLGEPVKPIAGGSQVVTSRLISLEKENQQHISTISELKIALNRAEHAIHELEHKNRELSERVKYLETRPARLQIEQIQFDNSDRLLLLQRELERVSSENLRLHEQTRATQQYNDQLQHQLTIFQNEPPRLERIEVENTEKIRSLHRELESAYARNSELQSRLERMHLNPPVVEKVMASSYVPQPSYVQQPVVTQQPLLTQQVISAPAPVQTVYSSVPTAAPVHSYSVHPHAQPVMHTTLPRTTLTAARPAPIGRAMAVPGDLIDERLAQYLNSGTYYVPFIRLASGRYRYGSMDVDVMISPKGYLKARHVSWHGGRWKKLHKFISTYENAEATFLATGVRGEVRSHDKGFLASMFGL